MCCLVEIYKLYIGLAAIKNKNGNAFYIRPGGVGSNPGQRGQYLEKGHFHFT